MLIWSSGICSFLWVDFAKGFHFNEFSAHNMYIPFCAFSLRYTCIVAKPFNYSHSIVAGGLLVIS